MVQQGTFRKILSSFLVIALVCSQGTVAYSKAQLRPLSRTELCDLNIKAENINTRGMNCSQLKEDALEVKKTYFKKLWNQALLQRLRPAMNFQCALLGYISKLSNGTLIDPNEVRCQHKDKNDVPFENPDIAAINKLKILLPSIKENYSAMKIQLALATPMRTDQAALLESDRSSDVNFKLNQNPQHKYRRVAKMPPLTPDEIEAALKKYKADGIVGKLFVVAGMNERAIEQSKTNPKIIINSMFGFREEQKEKYYKEYLKILNSMPLLAYLSRPIRYDENTFKIHPEDLPILFEGVLKTRDNNFDTQEDFQNKLGQYIKLTTEEADKFPIYEDNLLPLMAYQPIINYFLMRGSDKEIFVVEDLEFKKVSEVLLDKFGSQKFWKGLGQGAFALAAGLTCGAALRTGAGLLSKLGYRIFVTLTEASSPELAVICGLSTGPFIDLAFYFDWDKHYRSVEREFFSFFENSVTKDMDEETYKIGQETVMLLNELDEIEKERNMQYIFILLGGGLAAKTLNFSSLKVVKKAQQLIERLNQRASDKLGVATP